MIHRLLPAWERRWRCRSCGGHHHGLWPICEYNNMPRDFL